MLRKSLAVLYTALALGANPAAADIAALRDGDMKKLALHSAPVALADACWHRLAPLSLGKLENGEIVWPVSGVTVAGNLAELWTRLERGSDLEFRGSFNSPSLMFDGVAIAGK